MESKKQNKQNRNRLIDADNTLIVTDRWEGVGDWVEKGEGIKKHKLVITK